MQLCVRLLLYPLSTVKVSASGFDLIWDPVPVPWDTAPNEEPTQLKVFR